MDIPGGSPIQLLNIVVILAVFENTRERERAICFETCKNDP